MQTDIYPLTLFHDGRCPVCRNVTTMTSRGFLRKHRDVYGHDCWNLRPEETSD